MEKKLARNDQIDRIFMLMKTFLTIDCGYLCFEQKYENIKKINLEIIVFTAVKNTNILYRRVIVMVC